jgi:GT2 family glycosyltransferase
VTTLSANRVSTIVLAYGDEAALAECVDAVLASTGVDVDVVLVDNGCTVPGLVDTVAKRDRVTLVTPAENTGYAGGCNIGAGHATGDVLAFVNSDAIVAPTALAALVQALEDEQVGLVTASLRLAEDPTLLNAAGNPLNILGVAWAGHFREPATDYDTPQPVTLISGATFACRRSVWDALGGFDAAYFAYHEDTELSVRCWQRGWQIRYVPDAVSVHHYEFSRNPRKLSLVERNRLFNLSVLWQRRTLLLLLPALVGFELAMLGLAARQGWLRGKVDGYRWLWQHRHHLRARRAQVQRERVVPDRVVARMLTPAITAANMELPAGIRVVNAALTTYWWLVRRLI